MKTRFLLFAISATVFSSCSTLYKSGQTPDDVYFSPGAEQSGYVNNDRNNEYEDGYVDLDDRYLRMKSSSRRWSSFDDDFMYWNNPSWNNQFMFNSWNRPSMGWNLGFGSMWGGSMYGMNSFNNPFYSPFNSPFHNPYSGGFGSMYGNPFSPFYYGTPVVIINNPKPISTNPRANGPRTYNLGTYGSSNNSYTDPRNGRTFSSGSGTGTNSGIRIFNSTGSSNSNRSSGYIGTGGSTSKPRGGYNNSDNNTNSSTPVRTFESSGGSQRSSNSSGNSGGSSSSGGSSGGSAPVRSFPRGGGN